MTRIARPDYDLESVRSEFPTLGQTVYDRPLVYLDNAATAQMPAKAIDAVREFQTRDRSNIHRGVHALSVRATEHYEAARVTASRFINATSPKECVFVRGTTEAVNLVAWSFVRPRVSEGDSILITGLEHHSNIVPWQLLGEATGARLKVVPLRDDGTISVDDFAQALTPDVRFASFAHVSNALGTVNPVGSLTALCREKNIPCLIDGAQAAPHIPIDVKELGADFYAFSGHKVYGPTGIGILWGRAQHLEAMPPWQGGGEMISSVSFEGSTWNAIPHKFEAGTPNIGGAIGLGAALEWLMDFGIAKAAAWETALLEHATQVLGTIPGLRIIGTAPEKAGVLSFVIEGAHPHDIGTILDRDGVAIRAGHHCAEPVMRHFGIPATARASFALYNTMEEIEALSGSVRRVQEMFADV
ncbi:MAG TPA: cysteine desulfurase [Planctomycetes bacterium]|nr:cysteine desulfurase [Planctomycetota bacterium]